MRKNWLARAIQGCTIGLTRFDGGEVYVRELKEIWFLSHCCLLMIRIMQRQESEVYFAHQRNCQSRFYLFSFLAYLFLYTAFYHFGLVCRTNRESTALTYLHGERKEVDLGNLAAHHRCRRHSLHLCMLSPASFLPYLVQLHSCCESCEII